MSILQIDFVPTDGIRLPIDGSGDFGKSPFFGQLSGKLRALTVHGRYTVSGSMPMSELGQKRTF